MPARHRVDLLRNSLRELARDTVILSSLGFNFVVKVDACSRLKVQARNILRQIIVQHSDNQDYTRTGISEGLS
jgi:hypothetical protein